MDINSYVTLSKFLGDFRRTKGVTREGNDITDENGELIWEA